ncbi:MAG: hypothetical protein HC857_16895 [Synechococcales cyanobacterium RU_4_20]|nr:hypothetical protein [Synechococcales cyanobacterium RU_4_20]
MAHIQALCEAIASRPSQPTAVRSPVLNPFPICIIPFDNDCTQIQAWIATQPHLTLFQDRTSLLKWETFYAAVWASQALIHRLSQRYATHHGDVHYARKFCAFDGPFERFVVYDAMRGGQQVDESGPCLDFAQVDPNQIFTQLDRYDLAVEDWEWLKPEPGATLDLAYAADALGCAEERVRDRLHGAHWFGARASLFPPDVLTGLCQNLMEGGELRWINPLRWWDEAALFNYMTLRTEARVMEPGED